MVIPPEFKRGISSEDMGTDREKTAVDGLNSAVATWAEKLDKEFLPGVDSVNAITWADAWKDAAVKYFLKAAQSTILTEAGQIKSKEAVVYWKNPTPTSSKKHKGPAGKKLK